MALVASALNRSINFVTRNLNYESQSRNCSVTERRLRVLYIMYSKYTVQKAVDRPDPGRRQMKMNGEMRVTWRLYKGSLFHTLTCILIIPHCKPGRKHFCSLCHTLNLETILDTVNLEIV
jgi:hypothetical protein